MPDLDFRERAVDPTAFERQLAEQAGDLAVPAALPAVSVQDGIISAQKVAVERNELKILEKLKVLAAAAGENWYYRWPVNNRDGSTTWVEGPSIKLANDLARIYGNCQVDVRAFDQGDSWMLYARFVDIESGYSLTRAFQQRKNQQTIKTKDAGRALDIVFQIGQSKAIRNVVCNALQTLADFAKEEAKNNLVERVGKKLDEYRTKVMIRLTDLKIDQKRVEATVGRTAENWLAHDVARIIAELQAIQDGMAHPDDLYPDPNAPTERPKRSETAEKLDAAFERQRQEAEAKEAAEAKPPQTEEKAQAAEPEKAEAPKEEARAAEPQAAGAPEQEAEQAKPEAETGLPLESAAYPLRSIGGRGLLSKHNDPDEFAEAFMEQHEKLLEPDNGTLAFDNLETIGLAIENCKVAQNRANLEALVAGLNA